MRCVFGAATEAHRPTFLECVGFMLFVCLFMAFVRGRHLSLVSLQDLHPHTPVRFHLPGELPSPVASRLSAQINCTTQGVVPLSGKSKHWHRVFSPAERLSESRGSSENEIKECSHPFQTSYRFHYDHNVDRNFECIAQHGKNQIANIDSASGQRTS